MSTKLHLGCCHSLECAYRHVKALESRSQLLDAALASADEANRRWEDCRALVDQLRIENAALRAALQEMQRQQQANSGGASGPGSVALSVLGPAGSANGTNVPSKASPASADRASDSRPVASGDGPQPEKS